MLRMNLDTIFQIRNAQSRSISAENPDGARAGGGRATAETTLHPGSADAARELGQGWKVSPCASIPAGSVFTMARITGPGVVRHVWITVAPEFLRNLALEVYYDGASTPGISVPLGDFFCQAWGVRSAVLAIPVNVNSSGGMNSFWPMPFCSSIEMRVRNDGATDCEHFFYTVNYTLEEVADDAAYLQASWQRTNPLVPGTDLTIVGEATGRGHFVGCFLAWQQNSSGWWGEGEVKVFLDDDDEFPTICGTGTEDYFGGAWCFDDGDYSAPYMGFRSMIGTTATVGARMGMYRFHLPDPIHFATRLRVTCQGLGWRSGHRYHQVQDDVAATAWWYQQAPLSAVPELPDADSREQV